MAEARARRISYDRFWGLLLLVAGFLPARLDGRSYLWHLVADTGGWARLWIVLTPVAGAFAVTAGFAGWRGRWRHFTNFAFGVALVALPVFFPRIWQDFPNANPAALPLGGLGTVGWVVLVAMTAIYAGSGVRVARPSQIVGPALGGLGALMLGIFAFLPMEDETTSFGWTLILAMRDFESNWRELTPYLFGAAAALFGTINLVRSRAEVFLAKVTRFLMVSGLLFWIALPFIESGGASLKSHLPVAWGGLHAVAPLFLSLDACVAFVAISITRSED
jgi:hypothetical protein